MEPECENGSNNRVEDGKPLLEETSPDFATPSVSSPSTLLPEFDGNPSSRPEYVPAPDITTQTTPPWSMTSTSPPVTDISNASQDLAPPSQMKSPPPVQTMGRPVGYDPNRIPSSIFSTKSSNPTEWSTASNESLFSIQMGNNSFTQDHLLGKSGELPWLEDWNNAQFANPQHGVEAKSNEMMSSLPTVMEGHAHEESSVKSPEKVEMEDPVKSPKVIDNHAKEKIEIVPAVATKVAEAKGDPTPPETPNNLTSSSTHHSSYSNPRLSDESGHSGSSFAFPVLVNESVKAGSMKAVAEKPEKPKLQEQVPKSTPKAPKATKRKCFCCFSCWPKCC